MQKVGTGRLARQVDSRGAFAEVTVQLEPAQKLSISFDGCDASDVHPEGEIHYQIAVAFGVRFAFEKLAFLDRHAPFYRVRVLSIRTMVVDSTEAFVAYAAAKACYVALGRTDDPVELDMGNRAVIFRLS
jgi:hypothetical protein